LTDFRKTNWANPEFSRGYRDNAEVFIVGRRHMLSVLQSFYAHFIMNGRPRKMLDLGCGDGIVASAIAEVDRTVSVTLVDGSRDMLVKASERLKGRVRHGCIRSSFQEMIRKNTVRGAFDFIASSLAIHHLAMNEKVSLFREIFSLLNTGGYFINIDVVLAPTEPLEQWYLSLWRDWIDERRWDLGISDDRFGDIVRRYKEAEENKPDTLKEQMDALEQTGFRDVDCYYKNGIFAIFGGRK
jgi:tRNA (cmo5U34)-methyltransferase